MRHSHHSSHTTHCGNGAPLRRPGYGAGVRRELLDELFGFIERGDMWDVAALERVAHLLSAETEATHDSLPALLAKVFTAILMRMKMGPIDPHLRFDLEALVYQRLWKVLEGYWDDMPPAEIRMRIEVFNRRLSRMIVAEDPQATPAGPALTETP